MRKVSGQSSLQAAEKLQKAIDTGREIRVSNTKDKVRVISGLETKLLHTFPKLRVWLADGNSSTKWENRAKDLIKSKLFSEAQAAKKENLNSEDKENIKEIFLSITSPSKKRPDKNVLNHYSEAVEKIEKKTGSNYIHKALKSVEIDSLRKRIHKIYKLDSTQEKLLAEMTSVALKEHSNDFEEALSIATYTNQLLIEEKLPTNLTMKQAIDATHAVIQLKKKGVSEDDAIKTVSNRIARLPELQKHLPKGMKIASVYDGSGAKMQYFFDKTSSALFSANLKTLNNDSPPTTESMNGEILNETSLKFGGQTLRDASGIPRIYTTQGKILANTTSTDSINDKIDNLVKFAGNLEAAKTLSHWLVQSMFGNFILIGSDFTKNEYDVKPKDNGISQKQFIQFTIDRKDANTITVKGEYAINGILLSDLNSNVEMLNIIPPAGEGKKASDHDFSSKYTFFVELSQADLDAGKMEHKHLKPPSIEFNIIPDWG